MLAALLLSTLAPGIAAAQTAIPPSSLIPAGIGGPEQWTSPEGLSSTLQVMLLLTVISLAPAVLLMTTSFIRILVVLGLLRQALGTQQLPPSQVLTSIALFMTIFCASILLPFPLTNTIPGIAVAIIAFGLMARDGLLVILGWIIGSAWVLMLATGSTWIISYLRSLL
ncbi:MAG: exopolysaccharide biosynthesis protein [Henriciella sp.]|nr:exopolysaccharide biosynthesis protein [Henriciella sp.]